jgi:carbonic anhydrase
VFYDIDKCIYVSITFLCAHTTGSLTTPQCNEAVTWIIFPDPIPISLNQMAKFRSLSNGAGGLLLVDNYRHLQPVGNRKIYLRTVPSRFVDIESLVAIEENDEESLEWYYE